MLADNQQKWVDALRSGEYKQCKGRLHDSLGSSHCCLGVLNIVAEQNGVALTFDSGIQADPEAEAWVGLSTGWGEYRGGSLMANNDDGLSFSEIADIIESEPEGLFVKEGQ
jgi:hypothetical protein